MAGSRPSGDPRSPEIDRPMAKTIRMEMERSPRHVGVFDPDTTASETRSRLVVAASGPASSSGESENHVQRETKDRVPPDGGVQEHHVQLTTSMAGDGIHVLFPPT